MISITDVLFRQLHLFLPFLPLFPLPPLPGLPVEVGDLIVQLRAVVSLLDVSGRSQGAVLKHIRWLHKKALE